MNSTQILSSAAAIYCGREEMNVSYSEMIISMGLVSIRIMNQKGLTLHTDRVHLPHILFAKKPAHQVGYTGVVGVNEG